MTTYNGENHVEEQLESILAQTRRPDELIVSDDASEDSTVDRLRRFADGRDWVMVLEADTNVGVNRNFQRAIEATSGDIIAFADQDDLWHPAKLATQEAALAGTSAPLCIHDSHLRREGVTEGTFWGLQDPPLDSRGFLGPDAAVDELFHRNFSRGGTMMLRRDIVEEALPVIDSMTYDYYLAMHAAASGGIWILDEILADYRLHDDQKLGIDPTAEEEPPARNLQSNTELFREQAHTWGRYATEVRERHGRIAPDSVVQLRSLFERRAEASGLRATATDHENALAHRLAAIWTLWTGTYYSDFFSGTLSAMKDLGLAIRGRL
jgi:glycosyltransferase involved in cell wall biosynthesis